jgi:hypothetical protein
MIDIQDTINSKKYKDINEKFKTCFLERIGEYAIFEFFDDWIRVTRERLVRIENVYDDFVRLAVVDKNGNAKYYECCNYASLYCKNCKVVFI